jgi:glucosamine 6-phosphate synthetase-like amidotransferase/phosphosugar isomerase protein
MCGIAGIHRLDSRPFPNLDAFVSGLLDGIEPRGYDATGYLALDDAGGVQLQKASCRAYYFNLNRARLSEHARTVLLHTRFATQGKPAFPENNHPVSSGSIYCVHNGHVRNDAELFAKTGKTRAGQVDSEAIPALVAREGWAKAPDCLKAVEGDFAVALVDTNRAGELILAKGAHSPLVYVQTERLLVWASTHDAIRNAWKAIGTPPAIRRFHWMQEGEALIVDGGKTHTATFEVKVSDYSHLLKGWYTNTAKKAKTDTKPWQTTTYPVTQPKNHLRNVVRGELLPAFDSNGGEEDDGDELESGLDVVRCEDCGEWVETWEVEQIPAYGLSMTMCGTCADWARAAGVVA